MTTEIHQKVESAIQAWLDGLDSGNLDLMVKHTADSVIVCNEYTPTMIGIEAFKNKYAPNMAALNFKSTCTTQEIQLIGTDVALWVGRFTVHATSKQSGETLKNGTGRLIMVLREIEGTWKVILDVDNNDETDKKPTTAA